MKMREKNFSWKKVLFEKTKISRIDPIIRVIDFGEKNPSKDFAEEYID